MLDRRQFLERSALYSLFISTYGSMGEGPDALRAETGAGPRPIPEPHFASRLQEFVWRNWDLANTERMAGVLRTTPENILAMGAAMGLPRKPTLTPDQLRRIYVTTIRQNWHLLPDEQLVELLGWDRAEYEFQLKENDFLWVKLGGLKPRCERLEYRPPAAAEATRAAEIKSHIDKILGRALHQPGEPPFQFIGELSAASQPNRSEGRRRDVRDEIDLRRGWSLAGPLRSRPPALPLVEGLRAYLKSAFDCDLKVAAGAGQARHTIRLEVDTNVLAPKGGYRIRVSPEALVVTASSDDNLRAAIYSLQDAMEEREGPYLPLGEIQRTARFNPRYVYSYFALYGDPLLAADIDSFPDGLLERLSRAGVNGVWLQAVLRNFAPSIIFPEFGEGWEIRLHNLNVLIDRAQRYGIKLYFYINEPRTMPAEFFRRHPGVKGTHDVGDARFFSLCTSTNEVREWLAGSMAHLFAHAPGLGGIFCITASENLTNCYSHGHAEFCPRCSKRDGSEVVAEVIETFRSGVRRSSATARVIAWDWGWGSDWVHHGVQTDAVISKLSHDVAVLSVSEWGKAIDRGGFASKVGEYSISVVGPGPRATKTWQLAHQGNKAAFAKVQLDNTWEISAVPYIPVPNLILEHAENLAQAGVEGLMLSWTLGGYPSPNFEVAREVYSSPSPAGRDILRQVASRRYGAAAADDVLVAWETFSRAFREYPMDGGGLVYRIPTQHGPANLLRLQPTGYTAGMVLTPYDDYKSWAGPYPVEVVEQQFSKMAREWLPGLESLHKALARVPVERRAVLEKDLGIAETCYLHFQSVSNQIRFYQVREQWLSAKDETSHAQFAAVMIDIAREELELARRQYFAAKGNSTIAYEASNHYYYRPLDLVEKILNCQYVIEELSPGTRGRS